MGPRRPTGEAAIGELRAESERAAALARLEERVRRDPRSVDGGADLARLAGWEREALAREVLRHRHVAVADWLRAIRVELMASRLEDRSRDVGEAASRAGFASVETATRAFARCFAMSPGAFAELGCDREFELRLPPGFRVDGLLAALGRDDSSRIEQVVGRTHIRTLRGLRRPIVLRTEFARARARCRVEARGRVGGAEIRAAHRSGLRLFGLSLDPGPFERRVARMPRMAPLVAGRRGLTIPLTEDVFEGVVWSIVGQQVNLAFAMTCRRRLVERIGNRAPGGLLAHPSPDQVAGLSYEDLTRMAFSRRKAEYLIDVSREIADGRLDVESLAAGSAAVAERVLRGVRGFGPWSTHYVMMRSCGFANCVPVGDSALATSLHEFFGLGERPGADRTLDLLAPFAPHRSLACLHFWRRLGDPNCTAGST